MEKMETGGKSFLLIYCNYLESRILLVKIQGNINYTRKQNEKIRGKRRALDEHVSM